MKIVLFPVILIILFIGSIWYFTDPVRFPNKPQPLCEEGWLIDRRFGSDYFLGKISREEAREKAGGNIIYWGKNITIDCNPN